MYISSNYQMFSAMVGVRTSGWATYVQQVYEHGSTEVDFCVNGRIVILLSDSSLIISENLTWTSTHIFSF